MMPEAHKKKMIDGLLIHIGGGKPKPADEADHGDDEETESDEEKSAEADDPMAEVKECARDAYRALQDSDEDGFVAAFTKALSDYGK